MTYDKTSQSCSVTLQWSFMTTLNIERNTNTDVSQPYMHYNNYYMTRRQHCESFFEINCESLQNYLDIQTLDLL